MSLQGSHWSGDKETYWDYSFLYGPERWYLHWRLGDQQSPVDINKKETEFNAELVRIPLKCTGNRVSGCVVKNTGLSVSFKPDSDKLFISGGPLHGKYKFHEFHFHWGKDDRHGSEHTVDGKKFPAELHMVHWDADKYLTFEEAKTRRQGLVVVAVFLELSDKSHSTIGKITSWLSKVQFKNQTKTCSDSVNLYDLLPKNKHEYWTYNGSLTTPPCYESVSWIIFREPIPILAEQLSVFRNLKAVTLQNKDSHGFHNPMGAFPHFQHAATHYIGNNFRPALPVGSRIVWASFSSDYC